MEAHPLENAWTAWRHHDRACTDMKQIAQIASVEDFWEWYEEWPKVSSIFFTGMSRKSVNGAVVTAVSLFKTGIEPKWEDKRNARGGVFSVRKCKYVSMICPHPCC